MLRLRYLPFGMEVIKALESFLPNRPAFPLRIARQESSIDRFAFGVVCFLDVLGMLLSLRGSRLPSSIAPHNIIKEHEIASKSTTQSCEFVLSEMRRNYGHSGIIMSDTINPQ